MEGPISSMVSFVPIGGSNHTGKAWRRPTSFAFAAAQAVVPVVGAEFAKLAVSMPIGFIEQAGLHLPVAVMSPVAGHNLFIGPAGQWLGAYVPAALRSYPFRLGMLPGAEQVHLCIDEDSGLVVEADGVAVEFIDAEGNPTPATKAILEFLLTMERSRTVTEIGVAALFEAGLIQPWQFEVTIDGRTVPAAGLFRVDATALEALDDTAFLKLRRVGALVLAYLQLVSMNQLTELELLNQTRQQLLQAQQRQQEMPSVDEFFAKAKNETLQFH
jgi:hypothetical protein